MEINYVEMNVRIEGEQEWIHGRPHTPSEFHTIFLRENEWKKVKQFIDNIKKE